MTEGPLNLAPLLKKRVSLVCSTLRSRSLQYKETLTTEVCTVCVCVACVCIHTQHAHRHTCIHSCTCFLLLQFSKSCLALFAEGRLEANVDSSFHFKKVATAHDRMRSNQNSGKIILTW